MPPLVAFFDRLYGRVRLPVSLERPAASAPFQRLRFVRQTGRTHLVFPGSSHSRLEHSLGVAHLVRNACFSLLRQRPDVFSPGDVEAATLAALFHDVGHGPFSHVYDHVTDVPHEHRSARALRALVPSETGDLAADMLEGKVGTGPRKVLRQLVSNGEFGLDFDRVDYVARDLASVGVRAPFSPEALASSVRAAQGDDGEWTLSVEGEKQVGAVEAFFRARRFLYDTVYRDPTVCRLNRLTVDGLRLLVDDGYRLEDWVDDTVDNLMLRHPEARHYAEKVVKLDTWGVHELRPAIRSRVVRLPVQRSPLSLRYVDVEE